MFSKLQERLRLINTDKIDYHEFYTFTYGENWNERILTNIDNDEVLRIIFTCHVLLETQEPSISALWKRGTDYVMKNFPYEDLDKLYLEMGIYLGLSSSKTKELYEASKYFKDTNPLLDIFYKWVYNERLNNVNRIAKLEPVKPKIIKPLLSKKDDKEIEQDIPKVITKPTKPVKPIKPIKSVHKEKIVDEVESHQESPKQVEEPTIIKRPVKPKKPTKK